MGMMAAACQTSHPDNNLIKLSVTGWKHHSLIYFKHKDNWDRHKNKVQVQLKNYSSISWTTHTVNLHLCVSYTNANSS